MYAYKDHLVVREDSMRPFKWRVYRLEFNPETKRHDFVFLFGAVTMKGADMGIDQAIMKGAMK